MLTLEQNGYHPLTRENLDRYVPLRPGIFLLAVQLPNGVHQTFFSGQTDNLYRSLCGIADRNLTQSSTLILEYLEKYRCYFTYFVIQKARQRDDIEKMLSQTTDPVLKLNILNNE